MRSAGDGLSCLTNSHSCPTGSTTPVGVNHLICFSIDVSSNACLLYNTERVRYFFLITSAAPLLRTITTALSPNIEREGKLGPVWPRTNVDEDSADDIASHDFKSATDYFNALFDMEHYGTSEWDPNVDGELLGALGKDAVVGKTIRAAGLEIALPAFNCLS